MKAFMSLLKGLLGLEKLPADKLKSAAEWGFLFGGVLITLLVAFNPAKVHIIIKVLLQLAWVGLMWRSFALLKQHDRHKAGKGR